jgi:hypothetical protein
MTDKHTTALVVAYGYSFMVACTWMAQPYSAPWLSASEKFWESLGQFVVALLWPAVIVTLLLRKLFR